MAVTMARARAAGGRGVECVALLAFMLCVGAGCSDSSSAVSAGGAAAGARRAAPAGAIRLVTYNVENYLAMDRDEDGAVDDPKPEAEIEALLDVLAEVRPDILAVQEMGIAAPFFEDLRQRLGKRGLTYAHADLAKGADAERHVGVLSRFPMEVVSHHADLTYRLGGEVLGLSRGAQELVISVTPQYRLRLINLHLKSKRAHPMGEEQMRREEARLVRGVVEERLRANPDENLVVLGDMNDTRHTEPLEILTGEGSAGPRLADVWVRDDRGEVWTQFWRWQGIYSRFDFVLVSPGLRKEVLEEHSFLPAYGPAVASASDHRPVVVTIQPVDRR